MLRIEMDRKASFLLLVVLIVGISVAGYQYFSYNRAVEASTGHDDLADMLNELQILAVLNNNILAVNQTLIITILAALSILGGLAAFQSTRKP